jgi:fatty acid desaturase
MSTVEVLRRLRLFLLALSAMLFAGTILELALVNHTEDAIQWVAFVLAGIGLLVTLIVLARRGPGTVSLLRWCMLVVIVGSAFGIYEHVFNNIAFEKEIQPNATLSRLMWKGVSGANPLLAPGTLAVAGLLSLAGTYKFSVSGDLESN